MKALLGAAVLFAAANTRAAGSIEQGQKLSAAMCAACVRLIPGEHDTSLDHGAPFKEFFGPTFYTFDHRGVHFIFCGSGHEEMNGKFIVKA